MHPSTILVPYSDITTSYLILHIFTVVADKVDKNIIEILTLDDFSGLWHRCTKVHNTRFFRTPHIVSVSRQYNIKFCGVNSLRYDDQKYIHFILRVWEIDMQTTHVTAKRIITLNTS